jgi:hypothetical protein
VVTARVTLWEGDQWRRHCSSPRSGRSCQALWLRVGRRIYCLVHLPPKYRAEAEAEIVVWKGYERAGRRLAWWSRLTDWANELLSGADSETYSRITRCWQRHLPKQPLDEGRQSWQSYVTSWEPPVPFPQGRLLAMALKQRGYRVFKGWEGYQVCTPSWLAWLYVQGHKDGVKTVEREVAECLRHALDGFVEQKREEDAERWGAPGVVFITPGDLRELMKAVSAQVTEKTARLRIFEGVPGDGLEPPEEQRTDER